MSLRLRLARYLLTQHTCLTRTRRFDQFSHISHSFLQHQFFSTMAPALDTLLDFAQSASTPSLSSSTSPEGIILRPISTTTVTSESTSVILQSATQATVKGSPNVGAIAGGAVSLSVAGARLPNFMQDIARTDLWAQQIGGMIFLFIVTLTIFEIIIRRKRKWTIRR